MKTLLPMAVVAVIGGTVYASEIPGFTPAAGGTGATGLFLTPAFTPDGGPFALNRFESLQEDEEVEAARPETPVVRFDMYTETVRTPPLEILDLERADFTDEVALFDTAEGAPAHPKPKLLPDNMSLMERSLWGEGGIIRAIGFSSPLTPEVRKSELALRRTMLTIHQIGGFATLGLMVTAAYYGQRYLNLSRSHDRNLHQTFVTATIASYSLTALLAILSPPPLIRRDETSTTTIHKTLAWVHAAGMIVTPIIGTMIRKRSGRYSYNDLSTARFHQVSAYITTGVFAASLIVITF